MADTIAVRTEHLSKKYRLFSSKSHRLLEALHPRRRIYHREFWALRDITLEIPRGTTVGILGLNGSGKSTLLQIISSVLQPSEGTVRVEGRVAALLELGAGFNPELTGRENVVLNGTIMGLARDQIRERMDSIEEFADVGEFFDQPMRTFSSGMFMRVAFATAIHVDPDVLIIDEALSVGDAKFQEKCFRRFRAFQEAGKTILFVTHDRSVVPLLCNYGILLHQGQLVAVGDPKYVVELYAELLGFGRIRSHAPRDGGPGQYTESDDGNAAGLTKECTLDVLQRRGNAIETFAADMTPEDHSAQNPTYNRHEHRFGNERAVIIDYLLSQDGKINPTLLTGGTFVDVYVKVLFNIDVTNPKVGIAFKNKLGVMVYGTHSGWLGVRTPDVREGTVHTYRFRVQVNLSQGDWFLELAVAETQSDICDLRSNIAHVLVLSPRPFDGLANFDTAFEVIGL